MSDTETNSEEQPPGYTPEEQAKEVERLSKLAEDLASKLEAKSQHIADLVLAQPAIELLGYLWAQLHMAMFANMMAAGEDEEVRPDKELIQKFQFALEYIHGVWASFDLPSSDDRRLDEVLASELLEALDDLMKSAMMYCMASSAAKAGELGGKTVSDTAFKAQSNWIMIRGNRYQVLEEEFFSYILKPHDAALRQAYAMGASEIAAAIQRIADSVRSGFSNAVETIQQGMAQANAAMAGGAGDMEKAIKHLKEADGSFASEMSGAFLDMFYGGICNMSRHAGITKPLLEDLSYLPGENKEFFADGRFRGTPLRTLPARIKPGIKLGEAYYITDAQFIRDSAYRAIQRGLIARLPNYREGWNEGQKTVTEAAYLNIFARQLKDYPSYTEVYFPDPVTGAWVESDLAIVAEDILLVVESKAGVQAMHSPTTNFSSHERTIRNLITKAYEQCKRLIEYIASAPEVPIYRLSNGQHVEVARLRRGSFRTIIPIGLTVETFTPFSSMCKEMPEIAPILGRYAFISMSVDDLFVLSRFLPTTGELLHYLEVRQAAAAVQRVFIYDEIEHLGSYITKNRYDMNWTDMLETADQLAWDSFGEIVDRHFEADRWKSEPAPRQDFPEALLPIFVALDRYRPRGWLSMDSHIRNLGEEGRDDLARFLGELIPTLNKFPARRMLYGDDEPLQIWLCRAGSEPTADSVLYQGQVASLFAKGTTVKILTLSYNTDREIVAVACRFVGPPTILQMNYPNLLAEVEKQKKRIILTKDRPKE